MSATPLPTIPMTGLTTDQYADAMGLPVDFLRNQFGLTDGVVSAGPSQGSSCVVMPYIGTNGAAMAVKRRLSMNSEPRFLWAPGAHADLLIYQEHLLAKACEPLYVTIGESNVHAATFYGIPIISVPGREPAKAQILAENLAKSPVRLVKVLAGPHDTEFAEALIDNLAALSSTPRSVHVVHLTGSLGVLDVGQLHRIITKGDHALFHELLAKASAEPDTYDMHKPYFMGPQGTFLLKGGRDGLARVKIANTRALIVAERKFTDPETPIQLVIDVEVGGKKETLSIPAEEFSSRPWLTTKVGMGATVHPGVRNEDHFRAAVRLISGCPPRELVLNRTGWVKLDSGEWCFAHAGGLIRPEPICVVGSGHYATVESRDVTHSFGKCYATAGRDGRVSQIRLDLPEQLSSYALGTPVKGHELRAAFEASLEFLRVGPVHVTSPVYCLILAAVTGIHHLCLHLFGPSGGRKTSLAAALLGHLGPAFTGENLPENWSSTANAIETTLHLAKDIPIVIDEFTPNAGAGDFSEIYRKSDRVFRSVANHSARNRMTGSGGLRTANKPEASVLSTGEEVPVGSSLLARTLCIELKKDDVNLAALTEYQTLVRHGGPATLIASYIQWLAAQYETIPDRVEEHRSRWKEQLTNDLRKHPRTADILARLMAGFALFAEFLSQTSTIDPKNVSGLQQACFSHLREAGLRHEALFSTADPVSRFQDMLESALASGSCHVKSDDGDEPDNSQLWGWRTKKSGTGEEAIPQGPCIGYIVGDYLYLLLSPAFKAAQNAVGRNAEPLLVSPTQLLRLLKDKGLLLSVDGTRATYKVRRMLAGSRRNVIHLPKEFLDVPASSQDELISDWREFDAFHVGVLETLWGFVARLWIGPNGTRVTLNWYEGEPPDPSQHLPLLTPCDFSPLGADMHHAHTVVYDWPGSGYRHAFAMYLSDGDIVVLVTPLSHTGNDKPSVWVLENYRHDLLRDI